MVLAVSTEKPYDRLPTLMILVVRIAGGKHYYQHFKGNCVFAFHLFTFLLVGRVAQSI